MRSDINPCPCGKNAHMSEWQNGGNLRYEVLCDDDFCRLGYIHTVGSFGTEQEAIDAWNAIAKRTCKDTGEFPRLFTCSACGETEYEGSQPNYCPNCGAKVVE